MPVDVYIRRAWLLLIAIAAVILAILIACLSTYMRDGSEGLNDWKITFLPEDRPIERLVAIFRRGGFAFTIDGFVVWDDGRETKVRRNVIGPLAAFETPRDSTIDLSPGEPAPAMLLDELLALEDDMKALHPPRFAEGADHYEYFVYVSTDGLVRRYHLHSIDMYRRDRSFDRKYHNVTDSLWQMKVLRESAHDAMLARARAQAREYRREGRLSRKPFLTYAELILIEDEATSQRVPFSLRLFWLAVGRRERSVVMRIKSAEGQLLFEGESRWISAFTIEEEEVPREAQHMSATWAYPPGRDRPPWRIDAFFQDGPLPEDYEASWRAAMAKFRESGDLEFTDPRRHDWPPLIIPMMPVRGMIVEIEIKEPDGTVSNMRRAFVQRRTRGVGPYGLETLEIVSFSDVD